MPAAPKNYRAARIAVPRLPLPAILFFAAVGLGGSLFLAYTNSYSSADPIHTSAAVSDNVPVYSVRAVPFDSTPASVAARGIARAQTSVAGKAKPTQAEPDELADDATSSEPLLFAEAKREFKGFNRFSSFGAAGNHLTVSGATFAMLDSTLPGYVAPDAEGISAPVPESSTASYAAALFVLLLARALRASWHRHHRRPASKTNSTRP